MTPRNDKYDLSQASKSGKAGFETLQRAGLHYFHFNDKKGDVLLFSQEYQSSESRNNGMTAVKKNAPDRKRYEVKTEKNKFYFVLKAGNNQEIARSRLLDSKLTLDKAIEYLTSYPFDQQQPPASVVEQPPAPTPAVISEQELTRFKSLHEAGQLENKRLEDELKKLNAQIQHFKKDQEAKQKSSKILPQEAITSGKHSFRLEFYEEKNEPFRGRVEHLVTQQKQAFQGLDWEAIINFIASYVWKGKTSNTKLSVFPVPTASATNIREAEMPKEAPENQFDEKAIASPEAVFEIGTPQKGFDLQQEQEIAREAPVPAKAKFPQSIPVVPPTLPQEDLEPSLIGAKKYRLMNSPEGKFFFRTTDEQTIPIEDFRKMKGSLPNVASPTSATEPAMPALAVQQSIPETIMEDDKQPDQLKIVSPPLHNLEEQLINWMETPDEIDHLDEVKIETYSNYGVQCSKNFNVSEYIYFQPLPFQESEKPTFDFDFEVKVKPMSGGSLHQTVSRVWVGKSPYKRLFFINGMSSPGLYRLYVNAHKEKKAWHGTAIVNVL